MPTNALWKKALATAGITLATLTGQASAATRSTATAQVTDGTIATAHESATAAGYTECIDSPGVTTCFKSYGDKVRVYDTAKDGWSAVGMWRTDYGRADSCRNSQGADTWFECNYDMRETGLIQLRNALYDGDTGKLFLTYTFSTWLPIGG